MKATSSNGIQMMISKGSATPTDIQGDITTISNAKPAVVTAVGLSVAAGDLVKISGTGETSLDGKTFVVGGTVSATGFTLVGSDTSKEAGPITLTKGKVEVYDASSSGDFVNLCLASLQINNQAPGTVSTATYCSPSASVASRVVDAGTIDIGGWIDPTNAGFIELEAAAEDGAERTLMIKLPGTLGSIVAHGTINSLGFTLPLDGGMGVDTSMALASKPVYLHN